MQGEEGKENHPKLRQDLNQKPLLLSWQRKPLESVSSSENSTRSTMSAPFKPSEKTTVESVKTSLKGSVHVALKPKLSLKIRLPLKRSSPDTDNHDDDFV